MADIALQFSENGGDFVVTEDGDLLLDEGLETSIGLSLLTDRRAAKEDALPADEKDRRGWFGDTFSEKGEQIGSKIWLRLREKQHREVMHLIREDGLNAVKWLLDDKVVSEISASCSNPALGRWELQISYREPNSREMKFFRHAFAWLAQALKH